MRSRHLSSSVSLIGALVALAATRASIAQEGLPAVPSDKPKELTTVQGPIPEELAGRWIAACQIRIPSGETRPYVRLWELRPGPEHLELELYHGDLPPEISQQIQENGAYGRPWEPNPAQLDEIRRAWSQKPAAADVTKIEGKIIAGEAFPRELKADAVTQGSLFAISFKEDFTGANRVAWSYTVFGVRQRQPDRLSGTFLTASLAGAPMPIPITLKGDFVAYRLGAPAGGGSSWLARLLDFFRGCGRR